MPVNTDSEMESENGSRHHDAQSIRESEEADSIVFTIRRNQLCKLMVSLF